MAGFLKGLQEKFFNRTAATKEPRSLKAVSLLDASLVTFAQTLTEQDRQTFVSWSQMPLPWEAAHDRLFCEAFTAVVWESQKNGMRQFRDLTAGRPTTQLTPPLTPEVTGVFERMLGVA